MVTATFFSAPALRVVRAGGDVRAASTAAGRVTTRATAAPSQPRMHPDAARRRAEAEARQAERRKALQQSRRRFQRRQQATERKPGVGQTREPWWQKCSTSSNITVAETPAEYYSVLEKGRAEGRLVVVSYFAPWCRGCKSLGPKLGQIAAAHPDALFIKFNTESPHMRAQAEEVGIDRLPMFHFHKDDEVVASFSANLGTVGRIRQQVEFYAPAPHTGTA